MMMLTRISTSTAFTTVVLNSPIWKPTVVAARVAAACGVVSTNISPVSDLDTLNAAPASTEPSALPPTQATMKRAANFIVSSRNMTDGSSSRPVDTRKIGTNTAAPKKSIWCMVWPSLGTSRFRARPAKKAPTMPSMLKTSATDAAARKEMSATRKRTERSEPSRLKVQIAARGKSTRENTPSVRSPTANSRKIVAVEPEPVSVPETAASTMSEIVSVSTVAPTAMATAGFPASPASRIIG